MARKLKPFIITAIAVSLFYVSMNLIFMPTDTELIRSKVTIEVSAALQTEGNALQNEDRTSDPSAVWIGRTVFPVETTNIVVLSSGPRSGSTFLGELISLPPSTFYFYEPRHMMPKGSYIKETIHTDLHQIFTCNFSGLNFTSPLLVFRTMRHEATAKCLVGRCPAPTEELMQKLCLSATNRVLKTIKLPLVWIKNIVEDPKENVKFIHLVRDPRASFQSARKLGYLTAPEATRCLLIEQDLNASAILERRHPDKLIRITYEHLCLQPWDVSRELYHFIKNGNRAVCTAFVARKSEESLAFILKRNCSRKEPEVGPSPTQKSETTQRQTSNPSQFGTSLRNLIHTSQRIVAQVRQINVDSYQAPLSSEKPINDSYQAVPTLLNIKPYVDTPARKVFQRNCSNEHSSHQDLKQTGLYIKSKQFLNENFNSNNNNRYIFPREMSNRLELPSFIEDHLMVHLHPNILTSSRGDPHSTIRDYKSIYKVWRRTLTIHDLQTTQEACHGVITKLNHAFFTNLADLRNASIDYVLGQWRPRTLQDSCQI